MTGARGATPWEAQKQRVLLARALYRRPKLLVMDEGTSHLDTEHESAVNAAISSLGITRIVIAHRKETIAAAKRKYLIQSGRLTEIQLDDAPAT